MFNLRWPNPSSPQSGTLNILEAPNLGYLSQIRSNLDETFKIDPSVTTNIIFDVQLKMTPSFKSPVRNLQHPPSPQLILSQTNHVWSWSNFQDRPLSTYKPDPWYQKWPPPSSLHSGTLNVHHAPYFVFLSQIMSNLDQTFSVGPLATTNIIFDVQLDSILQVSSQEPLTSFKPHCNQNLL